MTVDAYDFELVNKHVVRISTIVITHDESVLVLVNERGELPYSEYKGEHSPSLKREVDRLFESITNVDLVWLNYRFLGVLDNPTITLVYGCWFPEPIEVPQHSWIRLSEFECGDELFEMVLRLNQ